MAPPGPATAKAAGTLTPFEQHQQLKATGQTLRAAQYYAANSRAIDASKPK